jgi:hypothetical protein
MEHKIKYSIYVYFHAEDLHDVFIHKAIKEQPVTFPSYTV